MRLTAGEQILKLPTLFYYPGYDYETMTQRAPVKTIAMLGSLIVSTCVSFLMHRLWLAGKLGGRRDFFACMQRAAQSRSASSKRMIEISATEPDPIAVDSTNNQLIEEKSTCEKPDEKVQNEESPGPLNTTTPEKLKREI